jgi:hypothetical protein
MTQWSRECRQWRRVWSIWWDFSFHHLDGQAKNIISQWSSILAQWPPWKVKNFKKPRPQWKVAKWLCKICSMCENMAICVKIWFSFDICVKIWLFLKCVHFLKSCAQFLMDTYWILQLLNFWWRKRETRSRCYASHILVTETRIWNACLASY